MSSVLHRCPSCGYETELSNLLPILAANPHCQQCGLSASEGESKMTTELATLFARQLEMGGVPQPATPQMVMSPAPGSPSPLAQQPSASPVVHNISQHYHHSSHHAGTRPTAPADQTSLRKRDDVSPEETLKVHDIEPSSLPIPQLTLFKEASVEQRLRLIELWRISNRNPQIFRDRAIAAGEITGMDIGDCRERCCSTSREPTQTATGVSGTHDDDMMDMDNSDNYDHAEPYVVSGYQSFSQGRVGNSSSPVAEKPSGTAYSHSTDPVYKDHVSEQQRSMMEDQYGAFQIRNMYFGCGIRTAHWLGDHEML